MEPDQRLRMTFGAVTLLRTEEYSSTGIAGRIRRGTNDTIPAPSSTPARNTSIIFFPDKRPRQRSREGLASATERGENSAGSNRVLGGSSIAGLSRTAVP